MKDIEYTASVQMAIAAVAKYILGAERTWPHHSTYPDFPQVEWPQPQWWNFTWFTRTHAGRITTQYRNEGRVADMQRVVKFFLGKDVVAEVTLVGSDCPGLYEAGDHPQSHKYWAVCQIRYRQYWEPRGVKPAWVTRDVDMIKTHLMDCVVPAAD